MLDHTEKEINQKNMDMRVIITKFQNDSDQKVIEIREELNKLIKSESNLNNIINDNFYISERQHEEMKKNISDSSDNIINHKKILDDLDKKIKAVQERLSLFNGLSSKVTRLYQMVGENKNAYFSNTMAKTKSQSPSPKRMQSKNSNPELMKINSDNPNLNRIKLLNNENHIKNFSSTKLIQKKPKNAEMKKMNINLINKIPSMDEQNQIKTKEIAEKTKKAKFKINISQDLNNLSQEKSKSNIKIIDIEEDVKEKEKAKEKEKINTQKISKKNQMNQTNIIQTLPMLTIRGTTNTSRQMILKPLETENISSTYNINTIISNKSKDYEKRNTLYNIATQLNNESHTQNQTQNQVNINPLNFRKMKKTGTEFVKEKPLCKMVSLDLSQNSPKEEKGRLAKSRKLTKTKYDFVNTLINDYRAKIFAKGYTSDNINDNNNEILDMPKRVSQAFGRTVYTLYLKKDAMNAAYANKNINSFGYDGLRQISNLKTMNLRNNNENNKLVDNNTNSNNIKLVKK